LFPSEGVSNAFTITDQSPVASTNSGPARSGFDPANFQPPPTQQPQQQVSTQSKEALGLNPDGTPKGSSSTESSSFEKSKEALGVGSGSSSKPKPTSTPTPKPQG